MPDPNEPNRSLPARIRLLPALFATLAAWVLGCGQSEIRGTYDIELEILGAAGPLHGTLVLSTTLLDAPSVSAQHDGLDPEWFGSDYSEANSCFTILEGHDGEASPIAVRLFEAKLKGSELALPIDLYRTPLQRIELVKVQFFANAIGGDIILHDEGASRPGRIHGKRIDQPRVQRCLHDFEAYRALLRASAESP